jgi:hypothetical protein
MLFVSSQGSNSVLRYKLSNWFCTLENL